MGWESKCEWKEAKGEPEDFKKIVKENILNI
jgi:hypothetical protein